MCEPSAMVKLGAADQSQSAPSVTAPPLPLPTCVVTHTGVVPAGTVNDVVPERTTTVDFTGSAFATTPPVEFVQAQFAGSSKSVGSPPPVHHANAATFAARPSSMDLPSAETDAT